MSPTEAGRSGGSIQISFRARSTDPSMNTPKQTRGRPAAHNGGLTADGVIHIKLPQVIKSDFVRRAQREGKTLSAWMVEAALERLAK